MREILFDKFADGKTNIVTMSFDDGNQKDERLVKLFNKYGIKGTFHLNTSGKLLPIEVYKGHEISCHTVHHRYPNYITKDDQFREWFDNRIDLEKYCGELVRGASYPYGIYDDEIVAIARSAGIVYSRTTKDNGFGMPTDFMRWHPTCHFKNALDKTDLFVARTKQAWSRYMFYIWGHSHELVTEEDWAKMEELCKKISGIDSVWYATNIEIYNYMAAIKQLQLPADKSFVYNPTNVGLWISVDGKTVKVPPFEKVVF